MALIIPTETAHTIGIDEFVAFVRAEVDLQDVDSIASAAPMLRALANDRDFLIERLNQLMIDGFRSQTVPSAQVIFLGAGPGFYLRANVWPSANDIAGGGVHRDQFAYDIAHDHNYHFLTVVYHGPGYKTDLYEYDHQAVTGTPGEPVDLRFQQRLHFRPDMVMMYLASRDVHTQPPPNELSITLNLMISPDSMRLRDQYYFDLRTSTLMDYPADLDSSMRRTLLDVAAQVGGGRTEQLLVDLAHRHPCRRTRLAAFEALAGADPKGRAGIWEEACRNSEPFVARTGQQRLEVLRG